VIGRSDETQAKQLLEEETVIGRSDETEEKSTITLSTQTCIICNGTTNNSNYDVSQYSLFPPPVIALLVFLLDRLFFSAIASLLLWIVA
jgi:hypothetical protein